MDKEFNTVVIGGTFDHLHKGHKDFVRFALLHSSKVIIGLTSDEYIKKISNLPLRSEASKSQISNLEGYEERKASLEKFLRDEKAANSASIIKIDDVYGITISDREIDALIVVDKTLGGAQKINIKRKKLGLAPLRVVVAPSVKADDGNLISSSAIRNGEINREGKLYINSLWLNKKLFLPDNLREELEKPLGKLIRGDNFGNFKLAITVGDVTTQKFNSLSLGQKISIIDYNVNRVRKFDNISQLGFVGNEKIIRVENPAGSITAELFMAIKDAFSEKGKVVIEILGEEDLSVLPVILSAPLDLVVFYGQPGRGVVRVEITEEIKEKAYSLVSQFITRGH